MDLWFSERHTPNVKLSIRVERQLYCGQSEFQRIDVFESKELDVYKRQGYSPREYREAKNHG